MGYVLGIERGLNTPLRDGSEEYLDSEKYEIHEGAIGGDLSPLIRRLNEIRRSSSVFRRLDNVTFVDTANDQLVAYVKGRGHDAIVVCVNLDPYSTAGGLLTLPDTLDLPLGFVATDLLTGAEYGWHVGGNFVQLGPGGAHVLAVR